MGEREREGKTIQRDVTHGLPPWATGVQSLGSSEASGEHTSEPPYLRGAGVFSPWAFCPVVYVGRESPLAKRCRCRQVAGGHIMEMVGAEGVWVWPLQVDFCVAFLLLQMRTLRLSG